MIVFGSSDNLPEPNESMTQSNGSFQLQALWEGTVETSVHFTLQRGGEIRREPGELTRASDRGAAQPCRCHHCADKAAAPRRPRIEPAARQHEIQPAAETERARDCLRAPHAGNHCEPGLGEQETRIAAGDTEIAEEHHLETAARHEPVDRRKGDLRQRPEKSPHVAPPTRLACPER